MPLVKRFEDLKAWQEARKLTQAIYNLTLDGDFKRDYGLVDQIRRASVSVMNNIVEGFDSGSTAEFIKFLGYAKRSGSEVQSCLYVALDQRYCSREKFQEMYNRTEQVRGLVVGFIRYLRNSHIQAPRHASTQALRHSGTQERTYAPN